MRYALMAHFHVWLDDDTPARKLFYLYARLEEDLAKEEAARLEAKSRQR